MDGIVRACRADLKSIQSTLDVFAVAADMAIHL